MIKISSRLYPGTVVVVACGPFVSMILTFSGPFVSMILTSSGEACRETRFLKKPENLPLSTNCAM